MITIPEELYISELVDIICIPNEEYENITLSIIPYKYACETEDVADIWFKENTYYIDQIHYRLRDRVGNEIVDNEVRDILIKIKNYLDILGFEDTTHNEY